LGLGWRLALDAGCSLRSWAWARRLRAHRSFT
jgi:hypothetical protein